MLVRVTQPISRPMDRHLLIVSAFIPVAVESASTPGKARCPVPNDAHVLSAYRTSRTLVPLTRTSPFFGVR